MSVLSFLASTTGRLLRGVAGVVLILIGLFGMDGVGGYIVAAIGIVPLAAGVFDFCLLAPLFGRPFSGAANRRMR